jgi:PAS domain S-box-containing protein
MKPAQHFEPVADIGDLPPPAEGRPAVLGAALAASEARYLAVLSNAAQAVWTLDPQSGAVVSGAGWQALTGQTTTDMLGFGWMAMVDAEDRERVADICRGVLSSAAPRECEFRVQPSGGECRVLQFKLMAVHAADRSIQEWIAISTDITDRVRARQEALSTEDFASRLVESTHDCVKVLDLEGRLIEDDGPSLSDDQFGRMQKPFYTSKPEGLGLGLSICREILAAHSSELRAERKDTGGVIFSFRLARHPE